MIRKLLFILILIGATASVSCTNAIPEITTTTSSSNNGGDGGEDDGNSFEPQNVQVLATYPNNGSNWNDYIEVSNSLLSNNSQSDSVCPATGNGYYSCLHGGERKKIEVTSLVSCVDLVLEEDLGALKWLCDDSEGHVVFYSYALEENKGLSDLLDGTVWRENKVSIKRNNQLLAYSELSTWWSNPIAELPENSGTGVLNLDGVDDDGVGDDQAFAEGQIFVLTGNQITLGYNLNINKAAIVTGSHLLTGSSLATNCNTVSGESNTPNYRCLLASGGNNFVWVEGSFVGGNAQAGVLFRGVHHARVHNAVFANIVNYGFDFNGVDNSIFTSVTLTDGLFSSALTLNTCTHNLFSGLKIIDVAASGLDILGSSNFNVFNDVSIGQITGVAASHNAINLAGNDNVFVKNQIRQVTKKAIDMDGNRNILLNSHITNILEEGIEVNGGGGAVTLVNQLVANTGLTGIQFNFLSLASDLANISVTDSAGDGIDLDGGTHDFIENLFVGNNSGSDCVISGGSHGIDGACNDTGATTVTTNSSLGTKTSFVGGGDVADSSNTHGGGSFTLLTSITDWLLFDNPFRGWGPLSFGYASTDNQGPCSGIFCDLWDWRIRDDDQELFDRTGSLGAVNEAFVEGNTCPESVHGNKTINSNRIATDTFLINATEIMFDDVGNENGLCESGESCIFSRNIGAYQGEGELTSECLFQDGTVSGVTLHSFSEFAAPLPGTLDNSFGVQGQAIENLGGQEKAYELAIQSDGKIVQVGYVVSSGHDMATVNRYNEDGSLDSTFASSGSYTFSLGANPIDDVAKNLEIDSSGKIVVVGFTDSIVDGRDDLLVFRLTSSGVLDTTFNGTGHAVFNIDATDTRVEDIEILPSGDYLISGGVFNGGGNIESFVAKVTSGGTLDASFGTGGVFIHSAAASQNDVARKILYDSVNDKILAFSRSTTSCGTSEVWKINGDGSGFDTSFNGTGIRELTTTDYNSGGCVLFGGSMDVDSSGRILVGTGVRVNPSYLSNTDKDFAMVRLNSDGTLDTTFNGSTGYVSNEIKWAEDVTIEDVALDSQERIYVTGDVQFSGTDYPFIYRLTPEGELDTNFSGDGLKTFEMPSFANPYAIEIDANDRPVFTGTKNWFTSGKHWLFRIHP